MVESKHSRYHFPMDKTPIVHATRANDNLAEMYSVPGNNSLSVTDAINPSSSDQNDEFIVVEGFLAETERSRAAAAGVGAGAVGLLVGGPFLAAFLGFGAVHATKKEGAFGDTARAVGDIAILAKDKAIEVNSKHHVVERSKIAATDALEKAKELNVKYIILERTTNILILTGEAVVNFILRHRLVERGREAAKRIVYLAAEKIKERSLDENEEAPTEKRKCVSPPLHLVHKAVVE